MAVVEPHPTGPRPPPAPLPPDDAVRDGPDDVAASPRHRRSDARGQAPVLPARARPTSRRPRPCRMRLNPGKPGRTAQRADRAVVKTHAGRGGAQMGESRVARAGSTGAAPASERLVAPGDAAARPSSGKRAVASGGRGAGGG